MKKYVFEIIEEVQKADSKKQKVEILQKHKENWALKDVIRGTYDSIVVWLLPEGPPPYRASKEHDHPADLQKAHLKFEYLIKGSGDNVNKLKREQIFISILETIHPKDSLILLDMVAKKKFKGISREVVVEAFPGLLKDEQ